jgi:flagellin
MAVISTNLAANTALRYLNQNSAAQSESLSKISSGKRIQSASDDASGLAIGTTMSADVAVLNQAATNITQGSSVLNTADGALSQIADILERMKSLTAQSQSGSLDDDDRTYIDAEYQQLLEEITSISTTTNFNGKTLLDGTSDYSTGADFLVGATSTETITVTLESATLADLGIDASTVGTAADAATAMTALDTAISAVSEMRANVGAAMSRFEYRGNVVDSSLESLQAAESSIMDVDLAAEQTSYTNFSTLTQAAISALSQANSSQQQLLKLLQ